MSRIEEEQKKSESIQSTSSSSDPHSPTSQHNQQQACPARLCRLIQGAMSSLEIDSQNTRKAHPLPNPLPCAKSIGLLLTTIHPSTRGLGLSVAVAECTSHNPFRTLYRSAATRRGPEQRDRREPTRRHRARSSDRGIWATGCGEDLAGVSGADRHANWKCQLTDRGQSKYGKQCPPRWW